MPRPRGVRTPTATWPRRCWRVSRRVSLPAADDLFRSTSHAPQQDAPRSREAGPDPVEPQPAEPDPVEPQPAEPQPVEPETEAAARPTQTRKPSGRVRHD